MRDNIEEFIFAVVLSHTYNNQVGGDVESPTGFYGTMSFVPDEISVDEWIIPEELRGATVIACQDNQGFIYYDILAESVAETWFEEQEQRYNDWN